MNKKAAGMAQVFEGADTSGNNTAPVVEWARCEISIPRIRYSNEWACSQITGQDTILLQGPTVAMEKSRVPFGRRFLDTRLSVEY
jgi:hypothetical protein